MLFLDLGEQVGERDVRVRGKPVYELAVVAGTEGLCRCQKVYRLEQIAFSLSVIADDDDDARRQFQFEPNVVAEVF